MGVRVFLCAAADVPVNCAKRVACGRRAAIAVFNVDGEFFALDDLCTHGSASLSAGEIDKGQVICPLHFGSFEIRTGKPIDPPCDIPAVSRPVVVVDGRIYMVDTKA